MVTQEEYEEWCCAGRLPRKRDGRVDFYAIDRALMLEQDTPKRILLLKRIQESANR